MDINETIGKNIAALKVITPFVKLNRVFDEVFAFQGKLVPLKSDKLEFMVIIHFPFKIYVNVF